MRPVYIRHLASELPLEPVNNEQMEQVLGQIGDRPSRARRVTRHQLVRRAAAEHLRSGVLRRHLCFRHRGDEVRGNGGSRR